MDGGRAIFFNPDGETIPSSADKNLRGNATLLRANNRDGQIEITPETTQSKWAGEKMDHHLAVSILCEIESRARPGEMHS